MSNHPPQRSANPGVTTLPGLEPNASSRKRVAAANFIHLAGALGGESSHPRKRAMAVNEKPPPNKSLRPETQETDSTWIGCRAKNNAPAREAYRIRSGERDVFPYFAKKSIRRIRNTIHAESRWVVRLAPWKRTGLIGPTEIPVPAITLEKATRAAQVV